MIRYIHLNPLRAGIVDDLDELADWKWSGHNELMGHVAKPLVSVDNVLLRFGQTRCEALDALELWMKGGLRENTEVICEGDLRFASHRTELNSQGSLSTRRTTLGW